MDGDLTSGGDFLRDSAKGYFDDRFSKPKLEFDGELQRGLDWSPSIIIQVNKFTRIAVEVSDDKPYPAILRWRRPELDALVDPVSIYCVCAEEAYIADQKSAKELIAHGFGLITVAADGTCHLVKDCIPLANRISEQDFKAEVKTLPSSFRRRIQEAYETYQSNPVSGLSNLCEIVEGMILRAGKDAKNKGFIPNSVVRSGKPAEILDAMAASNDLAHSRAAIGTMRGYISEARNTANHSPKSKKGASERLRKSKLQFLDGIRKIDNFRQSMKKRNLSGSF